MRRMFLSFLNFIIVLYFCSVCDGKFIEGTLTTTSNWKFITRFCFLSRKGSLEYEFEYPESYMTQNLLLYWDAPGLWSSVYKSSLTCEKREQLLDPAMKQLLFLRPDDARSGCTYEPYGKANNGSVWCRTEHSFFSSRERWWYIGLNNCNSKVGLKLKYKMWLRNSEPGDLFFEHFSADEFYILQTDICFLFLHLIILIIAIVFAVMLTNRKHFHSTYRLFIVAASLEFARLFFACIAWGSYARRGVMMTGLKYFSDVLGAASQIFFILMLLLMSLGYTIICGKLPTWMTITIMIFVAGLSGAYLALFIYEAFSFDPGWVLYRYESPSGYGLMALIILSWLVFAGSCVFTLVAHKTKRAFYIRFLVFYSIWFWAVPTIVFISINHIPAWMREKVVNGLDLSIVALGHLFYLFLTRPTEGNGNFPYHIRTGQIDVITLEEATDKALDADTNFQDIEPERPPTTDFSIFTTSRTQNGETQPHPQPMSQPNQPSRPNGHTDGATNAAFSLQRSPEQQEGLGRGEEGEEEGRGREGGGGGVTYVPRNLDSLFSFGPQNSAPAKTPDL